VIAGYLVTQQLPGIAGSFGPGRFGAGTAGARDGARP
jgi:hypothetical protein